MEARVGHRALPLGGSKQRVVLALLLLHANEVVPVDRLIDEVWGEAPPPSARHTLEGYVSRLRGILGPHRVTIARRAPGYVLLLGDAFLDVDSLRQLSAAADEAAANGDHGRASELYQRALSLWRGRALADVAFQSAATSAVEHLEELRLSVVERRIECGLALGRHGNLVGELQELVEEHPFRERFVAQSMLALHRCARSVEALELFERTRRLLDEELGLQPSNGLRRLSAEIVRQEPDLALEAGMQEPPLRRPTRMRGRALAGVLLATAAAAGVAIAIGLVPGSAEPAAAGVGRVALVLPRLPEAGREDAYVGPFVDGLVRAARQWDLEVELLEADELDRSAASIRDAADRLRSGAFGLILVAGFPLSEAFAPLVRELPETRFVFFEAALEPLGLVGVENATAIRFADEQVAYLAGYLAGLVKAAQGSEPGVQRTISVIGGVRGFPIVEAMLDEFTRGARRALPEVRVLRDYSEDFVAREPCETIANRQIDAGSDIVFPAAGTCGLGALAAAALRGVRGIGVDSDRSELGEHILASAVKRFDRAVALTVRWAVHGTLDGGRDIILGLDEDAVGVVGISPEVPLSVRQALALEAASLRRRG
jgi:basic membrane lipoprotein Med (substrate-binding protein (PBP1-ABC) superfamily)/DNA-binding SARP family transcriptional activator